MPSAHTVLGEVPVERLGITMPHEHIVLSYGGAKSDAPGYNVKALADEVCKDLGQAVQAYGVGTVVDAGPTELGRDVAVQREVARRLGVNIIAATGFYRFTSGVPLVWQSAEIDTLVDYVTREITEGVGPDRVKCGVIKLASSDEKIGPVEEKLFRAAARVSKGTGCPIITHSDPSGWAVTNVGKLQLDILLSEGADPSRIMLGHICGTPNLNYLIELVKRGCSVAFDRVGSQRIVPDEVRAGLVAGLCAAGYASHVMLSLDHQGVWFPQRSPATAANTKHFGYLFQSFLPRLRAGGVSERDIEQMTVVNPRNLLGL
jgi:phosphotriesterase-related protein